MLPSSGSSFKVNAERILLLPSNAGAFLATFRMPPSFLEVMDLRELSLGSGLPCPYILIHYDIKYKTDARSVLLLPRLFVNTGPDILRLT